MTGYADRIPAPRPVPTTAARLADARRCGHTPEQHRHDDGQAADAASRARAVRVLTAERDAITAENAQWQAEVAHLRDLIRQYGDDGKIPVSAISKALRDGPSPAPGSVSPRALADLAPWIRRAIGDPGSIAGRRRGPSWRPGEEGYAEEQETINAWTTRAILRVIDHGGRPHCERCEQVIQVDDLYDPPLPGIGLWEHQGECPAEEPTETRRLLDRAIAAALPLAGGRVEEMLQALQRELVRVDAKRTEQG